MSRREPDGGGHTSLNAANFQRVTHVDRRWMPRGERPNASGGGTGGLRLVRSLTGGPEVRRAHP